MMADFCKQCSIFNFCEDFGDLAGLITAEEVATGMRSVVLCEGCGTTLVDHEGRCINKMCEIYGKENSGDDAVLS